MEKRAATAVCIGLFLVTLSTLMLEIVLTRIFSVTMWYHFAFLAISIAMFGMTVGALLVYLFPSRFAEKETQCYLAVTAFAFAVSSIVSLLVHILLPYNNADHFVTLVSVTMTFVTVSIPFLFSGICVCLVLTRYSSDINKIYAVDLVGAATGCLVVKYMLDVTDGPTAVVAVALFATLGALAFVSSTSQIWLKNVVGLSTTALALLLGVTTYSVSQGTPLLQLKWSKGNREPVPLYEKWNSFSRIKVYGDPQQWRPPWELHGLSQTYRPDTLRQVVLTMDGGAATALTAFDGNLQGLRHLEYDVVNLAHYLRPDSNVYIIGAGGGRDVLSALKFRQRSVVAVEINEDILRTVNGLYGDFTGHLDKNPKVTFVNDEGRSYLLRSNRSFDIIEASMIDTWAATAAGAYTMTENSLYTVEAWQAFLDHLTPRGVVSFTRWYLVGNPHEVYRLTALASATLRERNVRDPAKHIIVVGNIVPGLGHGLATLVMSKEPFSDHDIDVVEDLARRMKFDIVFTPRQAIDGNFAEIVTSPDLKRVASRVGSNLAPPTYDVPFFFHSIRLRDFTEPNFVSNALANGPVSTLWGLLLIIPAISYWTILKPLRTLKGESPRHLKPHLVYFASIGLAFVLVEMSQIQKLSIFLGHPSYSLSVVLFSLLLSSGIGSYTVRDAAQLKTKALGRLLLFSAMLVLAGCATPYAVNYFQAATIPVRLVVSVALIFPVGFFMGMAYPLGIRSLTEENAAMIPWLWGVNGAASVFASVLALVCSMEFGITATYCLGCVCYLVAFATFLGRMAPATGAGAAPQPPPG